MFMIVNVSMHLNDGETGTAASTQHILAEIGTSGHGVMRGDVVSGSDVSSREDNHDKDEPKEKGRHGSTYLNEDDIGRVAEFVNQIGRGHAHVKEGQAVGRDDGDHDNVEDQVETEECHEDTPGVPGASRDWLATHTEGESGHEVAHGTGETPKGHQGEAEVGPPLRGRSVSIALVVVRIVVSASVRVHLFVSRKGVAFRQWRRGCCFFRHEMAS